MEYWKWSMACLSIRILVHCFMNPTVGTLFYFIAQLSQRSAEVSERVASRRRMHLSGQTAAITQAESSKMDQIYQDTDHVAAFTVTSDLEPSGTRRKYKSHSVQSLTLMTSAHLGFNDSSQYCSCKGCEFGSVFYR